MSYASGIGSQQEAISPIRASGANPAIQVTAADDVASEATGPISQVNHADQASLSSSGGLVAQALEASDERSAKVGSLQQTIAAGSYNVSSSDVAEKIIQSLLGKA
jgi:negative regulator of flagellin synthesis FlgM